MRKLSLLCLAFVGACSSGGTPLPDVNEMDVLPMEASVTGDSAPSVDAAPMPDVMNMPEVASMPDAVSMPDVMSTPDTAQMPDAMQMDVRPPRDAMNEGGMPGGNPVYVVLFTHIEDVSPVGMLGTPQSRMSYLQLRQGLIDLAQRARMRGLRWVLQPDWKYLEAARMYEDATTMMSTNGKNVFRYLRDDLGVPIDPHSHESNGYNYTDVAYLLEQLGVGGSVVIGGHIWDPSLPQFQQWDRFRTPVMGQRYPTARWRGEILMGSGTPNHVNDPLVTGVWHPRDRNNYFTDDPMGNIIAIGSWHNSVAGVQELLDAAARGTVPAGTMLTTSWNITPTDILAGIDGIDTRVLMPIQSMQAAGRVVTTDFTALVATWRARYGGAASFIRL